MGGDVIRVLVCGSRDWRDERIINAILDGLLDTASNTMDEFVLIEGGQVSRDKVTGERYGADYLAAQWAERVGVTHECYPAQWRVAGRAGYDPGAGPRRNQVMLDHHPDLVLAFKDGLQYVDGPYAGKGGTEDMLRRTRAAGVPCYVIGHG